MKLKLLKKTYAIVRYSPDTDISVLTDNGNEFFSLTKTSNEISLLCEESKVPSDQWQKIDKDWRGFHFDDTFAFSEIGILRQVCNPLAEAQISLLALATFDTDYVFIQRKDWEQTLEVLQKAGFTY